MDPPSNARVFEFSFLTLQFCAFFSLAASKSYCKITLPLWLPGLFILPLRLLKRESEKNWRVPF
jgi:hypothetical protein